jgi:hypothetical protein
MLSCRSLAGFGSSGMVRAVVVHSRAVFEGDGSSMRLLVSTMHVSKRRKTRCMRLHLTMKEGRGDLRVEGGNERREGWEASRGS